MTSATDPTRSDQTAADAAASQDTARNARRWLKQQQKDVAQGRAGRLLSASVALGTLAGIALIGQAALLAHTAHQVMFEQRSLSQVSTFLWAMLALILLRALLGYAGNRLASHASQQIRASLRERLSRHLLNIGPQLYNRHGKRSAELSTLFSDGIETLDDYYARYLPAVAFSALIPLAILALVLPLDGLSGLIFLVTAPLIPFFMIMIGQQAEKLNQQRWQQLARLGNHLLDRIRGLTELRLLGTSQREAAAVAQIADQYRRSTLSVLKVAFLSSLALEFLATISIALVAVTIGFRLYYGELDFGTGFLILLLAPEFYLPLRNLGTHYHARMAGVSAAEQMVELFQIKPLGLQPETIADSSTSEPTNASDWKLPVIELRQLHFSYGREPVLQGLNLCFDQPGLYAVVGRSGAGKSTLLDLLAGFIQPQQGSLLVNKQPLGTKQLDSPHMDSQQPYTQQLQHWRQQLGWLSQQPQLFAGSVADNLRLGCPDASDQQLQQAARKAGADEFIHQLPEGYQTLLNEDASQLSGGQLQRLALARAFVREAKVLLLDEPGTGLDPDSDQRISQALADYARDHIVIMVAQRLHSVRAADQIILLADGTVCEQGTHAQLMAAQGAYARLVKGDDLSDQQPLSDQQSGNTPSPSNEKA